MTVDLCGSGGPEPQLGLAPLYTVYPQRQGPLHIDAGKPGPGQQYNRFDAIFQTLRPAQHVRNFRFDTPVTRPYKRGSHGERGVPETSRVLVAKGFATLTVPLQKPKVSTPGSCVLCIVC